MKTIIWRFQFWRLLKLFLYNGLHYVYWRSLIDTCVDVSDTFLWRLHVTFTFYVNVQCHKMIQIKETGGLIKSKDLLAASRAAASRFRSSITITSGKWFKHNLCYRTFFKVICCKCTTRVGPAWNNQLRRQSSKVGYAIYTRLSLVHPWTNRREKPSFCRRRPLTNRLISPPNVTITITKCYKVRFVKWHFDHLDELFTFLHVVRAPHCIIK